MSGARLFMVCFAAAAALIFGGGAAVNALVDPYGYFRSPVHEGFNARKPTAISNDRLLKTSTLRAGGFDCITAGSSRIGEGLPLDHPFFTDCVHSYDASLAGVTANEMARIIRVAARHNRLERVVIGLDLFMFNVARDDMRGSSEALYSDAALAEIKIGAQQLFSLDAVGDSWTTVRSQHEPAFHRRDGTTDEAYLRGEEGQREIVPRFLRCSRGYIFHHLPPPYYVHTTQRGNLDSYAVLESLLVDLHHEGVEVILFVPPAHAWNSELVHALGLWDDWEDFKRSTLKATLRAAARTGSQPFAYWDFSNYSAVTAEPLTASAGPREMRFHWDCSHFKPTLGRLILDQWTAQGSDLGLGVRIDDEVAMEAQLARVRAGRDAFERTRPSEVRLIVQIVDCFGASSLRHRLGRPAPPERVCRSLRRRTR